MPPPWVPTTLKRRERAVGRLSKTPEKPSPTTSAQAYRRLRVETRAPPYRQPRTVGEWQAANATRLIAADSAFDGARLAAATAGSDPAAAASDADTTSKASFTTVGPLMARCR